MNSGFCRNTIYVIQFLAHNLRYRLGVLLTALAVICLLGLPSLSQDWIKSGTGLGVEKIRIAVPDFKATNQDPRNTELLRTFNDTLWNDLNNAGIFDMVSKSFSPQGTPGSPQEINLAQWSAAPASAAMVAFGNLTVQNNSLVVNGFLFDTKNAQYPQVLAKQYTDQATDDVDDLLEAAEVDGDQVVDLQVGQRLHGGQAAGRAAERIGGVDLVQA